MNRRTFIRVVGGVGLTSTVPFRYVWGAEKATLATSGILVEAASFAKQGGWKLDTQHYQQMGGCYLLRGAKQDFLSKYIFRHTEGDYYIPFRCLYSRNIANLMMAGRCFSCSHVGLGGPLNMRTLGQMGVATGLAAALCKKHGVLPRGVYDKHVEELRALAGYA